MIQRTHSRFITIAFAAVGLAMASPFSVCRAQQPEKKPPVFELPAGIDALAAIPANQPFSVQATGKVPIPRELDDFIARPEPAYKWEKVAVPTPDAGPQTGDAMADLMLQTLGADAQLTQLMLTSQEWQGTKWTHRLTVVRPAKVTHPDTALLLVTMGAGAPQEIAIAKVIANASGAPIAVLGDVPNQPLFGLNEDALVAHTFAKYLETGDASWPLLFPMTKSAVKAMDAVSDFATKEWKAPITKFVVTGASKRGWTSWLSAAADKRVVGIMPLVYNNLNLAKQMPHQLEVWGAYSKSISDYTALNLPAAMATPRGQQLAAIVDPWTYRERFKIPMLIVNAANDSYWPLDALDLYRAELPYQVDVLYVPNAGHSMAGEEMRVFGTLNDWFSRLLENKPAPLITLTPQIDEKTGAAKFALRVHSGGRINAARLWIARSATRDFRGSEWKAQTLPTMPNDAGQSDGQIDVPAATAEQPYSAVFAEIDILKTGALVPLRLSSDVYQWKSPTP